MVGVVKRIYVVLSVGLSLAIAMIVAGGAAYVAFHLIDPVAGLAVGLVLLSITVIDTIDLAYELGSGSKFISWWRNHGSDQSFFVRFFILIATWALLVLVIYWGFTNGAIASLFEPYPGAVR